MRKRVNEGGHNIPADIIERRYKRVEKFIQIVYS